MAKRPGQPNSAAPFLGKRGTFRAEIVPNPVDFGVATGRRSVAELARRTAGAEEHHLVSAVIIEVDQVPLPPAWAPIGAPFALAADKLRQHRTMIARGRSPR